MPLEPIAEVVRPEQALIVVPLDWASYTEVEVRSGVCGRCGNPTEETHTIVTADDDRDELGSVRACRVCDSTHWLFHVHGPAVEAARRRGEKTVT